MIGLGIMGSAMSRNLIKAGFSVTGFDIQPKAVEAFVALGGRAAQSVGEVGLAAEILITSLPSAAALFEVVADLQVLPPRARIVAETSTFTLDDKAAAQGRLAEAGIVMLDCPLSGSGVQALERDVLVYGSGPRE